MIPGLDASHYQGDINFNAVRAAGKQFVIMKATEGTTYVDPYVGAYYTAARAAGLGVGTYHFANAGNPIAEADHFCNIVMPLDENQVLVLDWEVNYADPVGWCWQFASHVHDRTGVWPLIYMSGSRVPDFYGSNILKYCGLWVAWYGRDPAADLPLNCTYIMHQYTSSGSVSGISGNVDLNMFYGTIEQFNQYGYHSANVISPEPVPDPAPVDPPATTPTPPVPETNTPPAGTTPTPSVPVVESPVPVTPTPPKTQPDSLFAKVIKLVLKLIQTLLPKGKK